MASLILASGTRMKTARCTDMITRSRIHMGRVILIHTIMTTTMRMVTATHMITNMITLTATTTPTIQNTR
jgi:hypothetical protein